MTILLYIGGCSGVAIILIIVAIVFIAARAVMHDVRLSKPEMQVMELKDLHDEETQILSGLRDTLEPAGMVFSNVLRMVQSDDPPGIIVRHLYCFRDPEGLIICAIPSLHGEIDGERVDTAKPLEPVLISLYGEEQSVLTTVGGGPDLSPNPKTTPLWWPGADFQTSLANHRSWLARRQITPKSIHGITDVEFMEQKFQHDIEHGAKSGAIVLRDEGKRFHIGLGLLLQLIFWTLPPGRWLWRNG